RPAPAGAAGPIPEPGRGRPVLHLAAPGGAGPGELGRARSRARADGEATVRAGPRPGGKGGRGAPRGGPGRVCRGLCSLGRGSGPYRIGDGRLTNQGRPWQPGDVRARARARMSAAPDVIFVLHPRVAPEEPAVVRARERLEGAGCAVEVVIRRPAE